MKRYCLVTALILAGFACIDSYGGNGLVFDHELFLDFNSGVDSMGNSQGDLVFNGPGGFTVTFTDDNSSGSHGNAAGVHITNLNFGNIKVGSSDLVLGAFNDTSGENNFHSSGIVANFSQGVEFVSLFDSDDDATTKTLFAFDELGNLIGQTAANTQTTFSLDTFATGGALIYSIEFDTLAGAAGGSSDGTVFTIDDFMVGYNNLVVIPEPSTWALLFFGCVALAAAGGKSRCNGGSRRRRSRPSCLSGFQR